MPHTTQTTTWYRAVLMGIPLADSQKVIQTLHTNIHRARTWAYIYLQKHKDKKDSKAHVKIFEISEIDLETVNPNDVPDDFKVPLE